MILNSSPVRPPLKLQDGLPDVTVSTFVKNERVGRIFIYREKLATPCRLPWHIAIHEHGSSFLPSFLSAVFSAELCMVQSHHHSSARSVVHLAELRSFMAPHCPMGR